MNLDALRASTANVLTIAQTAQALADADGHQLDERTIRRAVEGGQIPGIRVGKRWLVPRLALIAILDGSTTAA